MIERIHSKGHVHGALTKNNIFVLIDFKEAINSNFYIMTKLSIVDHLSQIPQNYARRNDDRKDLRVIIGEGYHR